MPTYRVTEIVTYEIEADSERDAVEWCVSAEGRDECVVEVTERYAIEVVKTEG